MEITGHHIRSSPQRSTSRRQPKRTDRPPDHRVEPSSHRSRSNRSGFSRSHPQPNPNRKDGHSGSKSRVERARRWSVEVEENFRLQTLGWSDLEEYEGRYGAPERWDNGFIKCLRVKKNGFFTYWQEGRECEDRFLSKVKLYQ